MELKNIYGTIIYRDCVSTNKELVEQAIKNSINLRMAQLDNMDLSGVDFSSVDLTNATFINTLIGKANFSNSILENVNFYKADISYAIFDNTNLENADFNNTNLTYTNIYSFRGGEYNRLVFVYKYNNTVYAQIGCLNSTPEAAIEAIQKKYGKDTYYAKILQLYVEIAEEE